MGKCHKNLRISIFIFLIDERKNFSDLLENIVRLKPKYVSCSHTLRVQLSDVLKNLSIRPIAQIFLGLIDVAVLIGA